MRRIELAVILAVSLFLVPLSAGAQQTGKLFRIGLLSPASPSDANGKPSDLAVLFTAFQESLRELGYVEGQNIVIEYRGAEGKIERLRGLATELTRLKVDLILAVATPAARAAQQATSAIPIVATAMGDPVRDGLVASLARPGGNVTGTTFLGPELVPKRLELLKQALPRVSRVAGLWHPGSSQ